MRIRGLRDAAPHGRGAGVGDVPSVPRKEGKEVMGLEAALSWGILPPDGVQVSWGARVIYTPPTGIDIVHDRQGVQGDGKELKSLVTWVNSKGLKGL